MTYGPSHALATQSYNATAPNGQFGITYGRDNIDRVTSRRNAAGDSLRTFNYDKNSQLTRYADNCRG